MCDFAESFHGYRMNQDGSYTEPVIINNHEELKNFIDQNVETTHELRIVDGSDEIVFQVVEQTLVFPVPSHGSSRNRWNRERRMFQTVQ